MIKIKICGIEQTYNDSLNSWIKEQFYKRGNDIWFVISIRTDDIKLTLPSPNAPRDRGQPYDLFNKKEQYLIDMWREIGLENSEDINFLLKYLAKIKSVID